jgi:hypothetical protein
MKSFFEKKIIICFVDVETDPRLRYVITGQKGDTRMGKILPIMLQLATRRCQ